ncbi:adenosine deaminase CECR1 [Catalinimonas alkaloidigena]|uniref:adenosine deaminase n=1 Tax=Catalinimonas alkaloidigena TaxID=1075417 RepID=A0A1G9GF41_9BACT|nr:hypothetical protein [Catalinimonas alkaloidigena]SDK99202.1 adenosine deaminase CECR1 [Catalinimonas alkaloidigena]
MNVRFPGSCLVLVLLFQACAPRVTTVAPTDAPREAAPMPYADRAAYLEARQALLREDSLMRFDADVVLSPQEEAVNRKLVALRDSMIEGYKALGFFPPAHPFYKSKSHIEATPLFQLFRHLPKGGLLHLHGSAAFDFHWLIERLVTQPNSYVFWQDDTAEHLRGEMYYFREGTQPDGFYPAHELAQQDASFREDLYELLVLDPAEIMQDTLDIWDEFDRIFQRLGGFTAYQPNFVAYHRVMFDSLLADGIQHVELRAFPEGLYDLDHPRQSGYYTADSSILYLAQLEREVQRQHPEFSLMLIYTNVRFLPVDVTFQILEQAYRVRRKYPDFVRGFDLVANEDAGHETLFFLDNWLKMDSLAQVYGVDMPLYLHDGETDWASLLNLYDAVLLNSRRIGHGFNLNHFPSLQERIKQQDICVEVSPLSNQMLDYVGDLRVHPASYLLRRGVQIALSSDDPAIFGYSGLSYDFWSAFLAWQLDLRALKKLTQNSLLYSSLPDERKQAALARWEAAWNNFIQEAELFLNQTP